MLDGPSRCAPGSCLPHARIEESRKPSFSGRQESPRLIRIHVNASLMIEGLCLPLRAYCHCNLAHSYFPHVDRDHARGNPNSSHRLEDETIALPIAAGGTSVKCKLIPSKNRPADPLAAL